MSASKDIDEETVWIGISSPEIKIGLGIDCWTSYVVYPHKKNGPAALQEIEELAIINELLS